MVIVRCKKPGFRRLGVAHPGEARYPDGYFSETQLEKLRRDPMFEVSIEPDGDQKKEARRKKQEA
jgi:multidrug resistance efflux pump